MPPFKKDRTILNIDQVLKDLGKAEVYEDEEGNELRTIYLGSILSLTPSGKIYTPWANSNVTPCPQCDGSGKIKNKNKSIKKCKAINKKFKQYNNAWSTKYFDLTQKQQNKILHLIKLKRNFELFIECPECYGLGSLEARLDQDWWNQLECELDQIDAWHHGSKGDGCDIMISRHYSRR